MPNTQTPYTVLLGSTAGSVYTFDAGGLSIAGAQLIAGTPGVLTIETSPYSGAPSATYGTLSVLQETSIVGTAQTLSIAGTLIAYRWSHNLGPLYDVRATIVGSVQTAGTLALYLR